MQRHELSRDDATDATIPRASHASNQDNPTAFNAVISAFLDRTLNPAADAARRSVALS
ncbi:hypothetical protein [Pseudonocardia charpentierae]|uniref:Alpha/beta hydrolase family protein n=1 Tax=Pseudonocardia charpentierae TaxID=3075545 RepID=A0ABU2N7R9_9PSEU|nr:hypothetical protein [Pseudonocardia sp. DSM 45834]MDT0349987.1 hypothetical protein [Pseudonocardia sp. DSM 45834]